jgi:hypothetical protein
MMKRFVFALACVAGAHVAGAATLTADELIAKNLAARGGAEKLAAIKTLKMSGKMLIGDFELAVTRMLSREGGYRFDGTLQGLTLVSAYDGAAGWRIQPFEGRKDAERVSDDEARSFADEGLMDGVLLAGRTDGSKIESLGTEDVDGTAAHKLRVTQKDGDEFTYYLDPDSFLEIKVVEKRKVRGAEQEFESELGDYEMVEGVYFPLSIESAPRGATQRQKFNYDTIEANVPLESALFKMPPSKS